MCHYISVNDMAGETCCFAANSSMSMFAFAKSYVVRRPCRAAQQQHMHRHHLLTSPAWSSPPRARRQTTVGPKSGQTRPYGVHVSYRRRRQR